MYIYIFFYLQITRHIIYIVHCTYFAFPFFKDFSWIFFLLISVKIKVYRHFSPPPSTHTQFCILVEAEAHTRTHKCGPVDLNCVARPRRCRPETWELKRRHIHSVIQDGEADGGCHWKSKRKCKGLTLMCGSAFFFFFFLKKLKSKPNMYTQKEETF